MLLILGESRGNFAAAERLYGERYPNRLRQSRLVFRRLLNRVRETGNIQPTHNRGNRIMRPVRHERAADVLAAAIVDPHISTRRLARDAGMNHVMVWRILSDQKFHPYHVNLHQALSGQDFQNRINFCNWFRSQNFDFSRGILWSDEATFKSTGEVNIHNAHYWSAENPHWLREIDNQHLWSLNVWCGIIGRQIIGPYFFDRNLTGPVYSFFLENSLPVLLEDVPLATRLMMWYQQDGCPAHYSVIARQALNAIFPGRWIGRAGPVAWPPRSPDLTPLDFFLWGRVKDLVYQQQPTTREDMKRRIQNACLSLSPQEVLRAIDSVRQKAHRCLQQNGSHFEHLPP